MRRTAVPVTHFLTIWFPVAMHSVLRENRRSRCSGVVDDFFQQFCDGSADFAPKRAAMQPQPRILGFQNRVFRCCLVRSGLKRELPMQTCCRPFFFNTFAAGVPFSAQNVCNCSLGTFLMPHKDDLGAPPGTFFNLFEIF